ncbi:hypothetical protein, partial [Paraburkholderia tuberum]|uniref:hypothetical protein n=1 Tax=Paraburkholderia tuberum TaxID=157910 RepID=UPI0019551815
MEASRAETPAAGQLTLRKSGHLNLAKSGHYNLASTRLSVDNLSYVKFRILREHASHARPSMRVPRVGPTPQVMHTGSR